MDDKVPRMVKLQLNTSGAWKDVLRFDIDAVDDQAIQIAAVQLMELAYPGGRAKLRIATADTWQTALVYWDGKAGWRPA